MAAFTYGSVCSGIEAASVAWRPLGWKAAFVSEIEAFPRAVLQHRWPEIPLHGDFTTIRSGDYQPIDLLVGGTPCQSFSVAGLRGGLDDERGNLALEYLRLADRLRPRWLVWENVPGVLSSNGGRDFGSILGGLVELGYGFAYRVLDAQFFGVAQRRRRVFVVGHLGDWRRAAAVLFERHSLSGHPAPRREAGEGSAYSPALRAQANSSHRADSQAFVAGTLSANGKAAGSATQQDAESGLLVATTLRARDMARGVDSDCTDTLIAHALRGEGFDASEDGTGRGTPIVPVTFSIMPQNSGKDYKAREVEVAQPVMAGGPVGGNQGGDYIVQPVAFAQNQLGEVRSGDVFNTLNTNANASGRNTPMASIGSAVRRLTPRECERLQGFPDDYTLIPWRKGVAPDGPRYKALGNSMAVPVMAWIGQRIAQVESLTIDLSEAA